MPKGTGYVARPAACRASPFWLTLAPSGWFPSVRLDAFFRTPLDIGGGPAAFLSEHPCPYGPQQGRHITALHPPEPVLSGSPGQAPIRTVHEQRSSEERSRLFPRPRARNRFSLRTQHAFVSSALRRGHYTTFRGPEWPFILAPSFIPHYRQSVPRRGFRHGIISRLLSPVIGRSFWLLEQQLISSPGQSELIAATEKLR